MLHSIRYIPSNHGEVGGNGLKIYSIALSYLVSIPSIKYLVLDPQQINGYNTATVQASGQECTI